MRAGGEVLHPVAEQVGLECGIEAQFQRLVRFGTGLHEPALRPRLGHRGG